jgi:hypothetical protein
MKKALCFLFICTIFLFVSCNRFGKKIKISDRTDIYMRDNSVTDAEARRFGDFIDHVYQSEYARRFQIAKDSGVYNIRMIVDKAEFERNTALDQSYMTLRFLIQTKVFPSSKVKLMLSNDEFQEYKTIKDTSYVE